MQHVYVSGPAGRRGRCVAGAPVTAQIPTAHSALSSCAHCVVKSAIHGRECRCGRVCARAAQRPEQRSVARARIWHLRPHTRRQRVCVLSVSSRHTDGDRTQIWSDKYGALSSQYFLLSLIKPYFTQSRASAHSLHESVRDRDRAGDDHNAQRSNVECVNKVLDAFSNELPTHTQNQSKYAETHTSFD